MRESTNQGPMKELGELVAASIERAGGVATASLRLAARAVAHLEDLCAEVVSDAAEVARKAHGAGKPAETPPEETQAPPTGPA